MSSPSTSSATPFYQSRTFWVSLFGLIIMIATSVLGYESKDLAAILGAEGIGLTLVNMALKFFSGGKQELVDDTQNSQTPTGSVDITTGSGNTSEPAGSGSLMMNE